MHKGLGVLVTMLLLALSSSAALALSEAPAAGSSPAAVAAPASSVTAPSAPPVTKVVPSDETEPSAAAPSEAGAAAASPKKRRPHHKAAASTPLEVESANARLRVTQAGWVYAAPSKTSKKLEKMTIGKFVDVTGSTRYYLQVKLKNGRTGYVSPSDVELARPTDKIFLLSQDAAVLEAPNRWAKKLAEVHRSHNIHVIGIALNYLRIRMKSGLTGYVTLTAVQ
jgi:hypothetical protein